MSGRFRVAGSLFQSRGIPLCALYAPHPSSTPAYQQRVMLRKSRGAGWDWKSSKKLSESPLPHLVNSFPLFLSVDFPFCFPDFSLAT